MIEPYKKYGQLGQFKELTSGAGSTIFKANKEGVFAGGNSYSTAKYRVSYTGNLGLAGRLDFIYGSTSKGAMYVNGAGIVTIESLGSPGAWFTNTSQFYVKNDIVSQNGTITAYNDIISQHGSITAYNDIVSLHGKITCTGDISTSGVSDIKALAGSVFAKHNLTADDGYVKAGDWISAKNNITSDEGGFIAPNGNFGTTDGNFYTTNGWISAGDHFNCDGKRGKNGTFEDYDGNTITVTGGIITGGI